MREWLEEIRDQKGIQKVRLERESVCGRKREEETGDKEMKSLSEQVRREIENYWRQQLGDKGGGGCLSAAAPTPSSCLLSLGPQSWPLMEESQPHSSLNLASSTSTISPLSSLSPKLYVMQFSESMDV